MTTQTIKEKVREEFRQYFGSRCIKHPDFFPDECGCLFDFIDSIIDHAISQAVKEREKSLIEEIEKYPNKLLSLMPEGKLPFVIWQGKIDEIEKVTIYRQAFKDIINLIKSKNDTRRKKRF